MEISHEAPKHPPLPHGSDSHAGAIHAPSFPTAQRTAHRSLQATHHAPAHHAVNKYLFYL